MLTLKLVRELLCNEADMISQNKNKEIIIRKGYFYKHGQTADMFAARISAILTRKLILFETLEITDNWVPFKGGATLVSKQSHFLVRLKGLK